MLSQPAADTYLQIMSWRATKIPVQVVVVPVGRGSTRKFDVPSDAETRSVQNSATVWPVGLLLRSHGLLSASGLVQHLIFVAQLAVANTHTHTGRSR